VAKGKVKWFDVKKGFGFIQPNDGSKDVFVHISAVQKAGLHTLAENQEVDFDIVSERGRDSAGNLKAHGGGDHGDHGHHGH
jgi:CspA family cold shock protein